MQDGDRYNPYKLFAGLFVPEWLARNKQISAGAKLAFGRLARYAGENGLAYPAMATLADEIGYAINQTRRHIEELERVGLIQRVARVSEIGQTSNIYEFVWRPELMGAPLPRLVGGMVGDPLPYMVAPPLPRLVGEESHIEESHSEIAAAAAVTLHLITEEEWPQTTSLIQGRFPSVDGIFMSRLIHAAVQAAISAGLDAAELTDARLRGVVETSFETDKRGLEKYGAGLLKKTVPQIIETLAKRHERAIR